MVSSVADRLWGQQVQILRPRAFPSAVRTMNRKIHDPAALASCENEPIHLLGAIQSIGFLLSISADWLVLRASANAPTFLGITGEIVGQPARNFLSADLLHDIRGRLQIAAGTGIVERLFGQRLVAGSPRYDVAVHVSVERPFWSLRHRPVIPSRP